MMNWETQIHTTVADFDPEAWGVLAKNAGPFLHYDFLLALETTHCVGENTAWWPCHTGCYQDGKLVAAIPGYIKLDSSGEYVFDHAWANAYHQYGLNYYPKFVSAIPFTPVSGPRWLGLENLSESHIAHTLSQISAMKWQGQSLSSFHWLFIPASTLPTLSNVDYLTRLSVQFQWQNRGYQDFADFLSRFTARKRKEVKKTRRRIADQQVSCVKLTGEAITEEEITFFYQCYRDTYLKRSGHDGYLTEAFFQRLRHVCKGQLLLIKAVQDGEPVASAMLFYDHTGLYGRYWGCLKEIDQLHFECCYFQGIEFAIANQLPIFNPGTQGEHKILRGFEPIFCYSVHKLARPDFHHAVADYLHRETPSIQAYFNQAEDVLPFNQDYLNNYKSK